MLATMCIAILLSPKGLRLLGASTDMNEAEALSYADDIIDIYSNSWGPADSGDIVEGPGRLTQMALRNSIIQVSAIYIHVQC